jgi:hypothetical protein
MATIRPLGNKDWKELPAGWIVLKRGAHGGFEMLMKVGATSDTARLMIWKTGWLFDAAARKLVPFKGGNPQEAMDDFVRMLNTLEFYKGKPLEPIVIQTEVENQGLTGSLAMYRMPVEQLPPGAIALYIATSMNHRPSFTVHQHYHLLYCSA